MKRQQTSKDEWTFRSRFRRGAFGWRSQPAITRIGEAVSEIKHVARLDPVLGAEGAVLFVEKLSPAIENVDGSSGAIGTAADNAIDALLPIIATAPAAETVRDAWLARLWQAVEEDDVGYLDVLPDYWGQLCAAPERASRWADEFIDIVREDWRPQAGLRAYFNGTTACLSCLFAAGRHSELLDLLEHAPHKMWTYRKWGVKALLAQGKRAAALRYAEESGGLIDSPVPIAQACEGILLASGLAEEAYRRYALVANQRSTYLATFRAVVKKYPGRSPGEILHDLVATTPGAEGKWFAAAKAAGLYEEAIDLARRSPCDPRTLTRAARDMADKEPAFAVEAGLAALHWLAAGYGYDVTSADVWAAYHHTLAAAGRAGCTAETAERIRQLVRQGSSDDGFVAGVLAQVIG